MPLYKKYVFICYEQIKTIFYVFAPYEGIVNNIRKKETN